MKPKFIGYGISICKAQGRIFWPEGDVFAIYQYDTLYSKCPYVVKNITRNIIFRNRLDKEILDKYMTPIHMSRLLKLII